MSYTYKNIKKTYFGRVVLDINEITFIEGKIYGIKGFNGSGKSTFCKILARIENPDKSIDYPDISIGYMPQISYVFDMSVMKNMMLNADGKNVLEKTSGLLKKFDLEKYKDTNAKSLSGGEKQKLSLARLMLKKYDMLILDEPTSSMDYNSTLMTDDLICEYAKSNNSIVLMVSHEEEELRRMTSDIIRFENGRLITI